MRGGWDLSCLPDDMDKVLKWFQDRYPQMSNEQEKALKAMIEAAATYDYGIISNQPEVAHTIYADIVSEKPAEEALGYFDYATRRTLFDKIREVAHYGGLTGKNRKAAKQRVLSSDQVPSWWGSALGEYTGIFTPTSSKQTKAIQKTYPDIQPIERGTIPKRRLVGWDRKLWDEDQALELYNLLHPNDRLDAFPLADLNPRVQKSGRLLSRSTNRIMKRNAKKRAVVEPASPPPAVAEPVAAVAPAKRTKRRRRRPKIVFEDMPLDDDERAEPPEDDAMGATASALPQRARRPASNITQRIRRMVQIAKTPVFDDVSDNPVAPTTVRGRKKSTQQKKSTKGKTDADRIEPETLAPPPPIQIATNAVPTTDVPVHIPNVIPRVQQPRVRQQQPSQQRQQQQPSQQQQQPTSFFSLPPELANLEATAEPTTQTTHRSKRTHREPNRFGW